MAGKRQAAHQPPAWPLSGGPGLPFTLAASFSLPWLPSLTGRGGKADVRDGIWKSSAAALGCGSLRCARGPVLSLGGTPQRWLLSSSQTWRTLWMCPNWRVVWFPAGSLDCLCANLRAASVVGRAPRSALAVILLHINAAVCRHSSLRAGCGSGRLKVLAALMAGVGGRGRSPHPDAVGVCPELMATGSVLRLQRLC